MTANVVGGVMAGSTALVDVGDIVTEAEAFSRSLATATVAEAEASRRSIASIAAAEAEITSILRDMGLPAADLGVAQLLAVAALDTGPYKI